MMTIQAKMDTRAFDAALGAYLKWNKRAISEIVNTKAYFVARGAVNTTGAVNKSAIEAELRAPGRTSSAPVGALIVNARRGAKGEKGLNRAKMEAAVNKLVRARQRTVNFLRSGWIPAIKKLESLVPKKGGAAPYKSIKQHGAPMGGANAAKESSLFKAQAEIWNTVTGGKPVAGILSKGSPAKVAAIIEDGLQKAINKEMKSMLQYINKKTLEGLEKLRTR